MGKFWDDFSHWLDQASAVVSKEAGDLTTKGKLKLEIFEAKRRLQEEYAELGKIVYHDGFVKQSPHWKTNKRTQACLGRIKGLNKTLENKEAAYKKVGKQT